MRITATKEGKYVPEWQGNRKLPESEQLYVTYQNLPGIERDRFETKGEMKVLVPDVYNAKDSDIDSAVDKATKKEKPVDGEFIPPKVDNAGMTRAMKPVFHNLETEDGTKIETWPDFLRLPFTRENHLDELRSELERELPSTQERIEEKDSKN